GAIARPEVDGAINDLPDSAAASDRLVIDLNVRMELVIFAEPLGIHGVRESGACPVQRSLGKCRQSEQCAQQNKHGSSHQFYDPSSNRYSGSNGAVLQDGYKRVNF